MNTQLNPIKIDLPAFLTAPLPEISDDKINDLVMPVFAEWGMNVQNAHQDLDLELPKFTTNTIRRQLPEVPEHLILPDLVSAKLPSKEVPDGLLRLELPKLTTTAIPRQVTEAQEHLVLPDLVSAKLPNKEVPDGLLRLELPKLTQVAILRQVPEAQEHLVLPDLVGAKLPDKEEHDVLLGLELPTFRLTPAPEVEGEIKEELSLPDLVAVMPPAIGQPVTLEPLELPDLKPTSPPKVDYGNHRSLGKIPNLQSRQPIVEAFDHLSSHKTFQEIFQEAIRTDSLEDVRMLRHHSLLKTRFLKAQFGRLIRAVPSLLPQSEASKLTLNNDQEQINLLAEYCANLTMIDNWKGKLRPNPWLQQIESLKGRNQDLIYQQELLRFKDAVYCFVADVLKQEQELAQRFGAKQKDLHNLSRSVNALEAHIKEQTGAIRMRSIEAAVALDFAPWEDRQPTATTAARLDNPGKEVNRDALDKILSDLQKGRPAAYQLQDYTGQVLSLPESNAEEAAVKAKYLLELGKIYLKFPTITALKRSLVWVELAIITLKDRVPPDNQLFLECHETRGEVWLKMGEMLKSKGDISLVRKRIDAGFKDFHFSMPLNQGKERNFVSKLTYNKSLMMQDLAVRRDPTLHYNRDLHFSLPRINGIDDAIRVDSDYAEAHYINFLMQYAKGQLDRSSADLEKVESAIFQFHIFELAAFYKSTLKDNREELTLNSIRTRLDADVYNRVVDLNLNALNQNFFLAKKKNGDEAREYFAKALLFASRGIDSCNRFPKMNEKKLEFLIKRAIIYQYLGLSNCQAADLEEAIALAKKDHPRYLDPSLHYALGCVYQKLNRFEEALSQFYIVKNLNISSSKKIRKLARKAELKIEGIKAPKKEKPLQGDVAVLTKFQDENIQQECWQVLNDHFKANSKVYPHRNAPIWETFVHKIEKAPTLKEFCETVASFVLVTPKVNCKHLLRLANLSNVVVRDLQHLDQIKAYVLDALQAYQEQELRQKEELIVKLEQAKAAVTRAEEFNKFKAHLKTKLKEGERTRPGSPIRNQILNFASELIAADIDRAYVIEALSKIIGEPINKDLEIINDEISEILEDALDTEIKPFQIKDNVLFISGQNVFLSQLKESIERELARDRNIREVHLMGVNVYVDCSLEWHGINVAIGAEYGEFLLDKGRTGREQPPKRIRINLSGTHGASGACHQGPAAKGNNKCDDGSDGLPGNDGDAGQPGGDLCIKTKTPIVGFSSQFIEQVNLMGGNGGSGSNGQDGGQGAEGIQGQNARTDKQRGDPCRKKHRKSMRHGDHRRGGRGSPSGSGGMGGHAGLGGKAGLSGILYVDGDIRDKSFMVQGNGRDGSDGQPGVGGKAGQAYPDGLDYLIVKDKWCTPEHTKFGWEFYCTGRYWKMKEWAEATTREKTIQRNQGREKGRGKTVQEYVRKRKEQEKHHLKRELFSSNLARHLHTQAPGQKAFAFNEVLDRRAVAHETEEIVNEQLDNKQKRLRDIETLQQTTAMQLQRTQNQQQTQTRHSRVAEFHPINKKGDHKKDIEVYFKSSERDKENLLQFQECSPIVHQEGNLAIHDVEFAMHQVNMTHGLDMQAIAKLLNKISKLHKKTPIDQKKKKILFSNLSEHILKTPLSILHQGIEMILEACKDLTDGEELNKAVHQKNMEAAAFKKNLEEEKSAIAKAYSVKIQEVSLKMSILGFLSRDRLLLSLLSNEMDQKTRTQKEAWFEKRLVNKVRVLVQQLGAPMASQEGYTRFAVQQFKALQQKVYRKQLQADRRQLQKLQSTLKRDQQWLLDHLPEICEQRVSPKSLLAGKMSLEELYVNCSKAWANISSQEKEKPKQQQQKPAVLSSFEKWMNEVSQDWSRETRMQLESHVKKLIQLKGSFDDARPYLVSLKEMYLKHNSELADTFITLAEELNAEQCVNCIKDLGLSEPNKIWETYKKYQQIQGKQSVAAYAIKRYITLLKNRCVKVLMEGELKERENEITSIVESIFLKVSNFNKTQSFFPYENFWIVANTVVAKNAKDILKPNDGVDLSSLLIREVIGEDYDQLKAQLEKEAGLEAIFKEHGIPGIKQALFIAAHSKLKYSQILNIIQFLGTRADTPDLNNALNYFLERADEKKVKFELEWQNVLAQGRKYDRLRKQVNKNDQESVEALLLQLSNESKFLSSDEQIDFLQQVKHVISDKGCFLAIPKLKEIQNRLVMRIAQLEAHDGLAGVVEYNNALKATVEDAEKLKELPHLFISAIEKMPFDRRLLVPCLIGLDHFPYESNQLIKLAAIIESCDESQMTDNEKTLKKECLGKLKINLCSLLDTQLTQVRHNQRCLRDDLLKHQTAAVAKISEVVRSSQILHAEDHIGKFVMWIKYLDYHFEIEELGDRDGRHRKALYEDAATVFLKEMRSQDTEKAIAQFHLWLRAKYNAVKRRDADAVIIQTIVSSLGLSEEANKKTLGALKGFYWRGIIPYEASEGQPSILGFLNGKKIDEAAGALLKLKFDDNLIHEECDTVNKELQARFKRDGENLQAWVLDVKVKITADAISAKELSAIYPRAGLLNTNISNDFAEKMEKEQAAKKKINKEDLSDTIKLADFLTDIEKRVDARKITNEDAVRLKELKEFLKTLKGENFAQVYERVNRLELKIIEINDENEKHKEEIIQGFINTIHALNASDKAVLRKPEDLFAKQIARNVEQLKNALSAFEAHMGEEALIETVNKVSAQIKGHKQAVDWHTVINLFRVLPRLSNPKIFNNIIEKRMLENWVWGLLEIHCLESIQPLLDSMSEQLPIDDLSRMSDGQKDEWVTNALKQREKQCLECFIQFKNALARVTTSPTLLGRDKENLLRLISDRLASFKQNKGGITVGNLVQLIDIYMASPRVMEKLSHELSNPKSTMAQELFRPSFESFKYALATVWINASLEPSILTLSAAQRQKLIASLFEIETIKKQEKMHEVIDCLKEGFINPAVVDCISQFAQGAWEMDARSLAILKSRKPTGDWYMEIDRYSKEKRERPRDLKTLVEIMAQEKDGINRSIRDLLIGDKPQLVTDIEGIKKEFSAVKDWTKEQIAEWVKVTKGENFLNDPDLVKKGIAVVSRAVEITFKYRLRDTQLITLWLMLRKDKNGQRKGRIGQMATSEGKSIVFACLDTLLNMSKMSMNTTTTSTVLAEREPPDKKPLFDLFGFTVSNNCDLECELNEESRKGRYFAHGKPVDTVYGDVAAFERDQLLTEFYGKGIIPETRLGPRCGVAADEIDGLFLDNASMVLYLSHDVDALRFVERIFAQIWALANHPSMEKATALDDRAIETITKMLKEKLDSEEIPLPKYQIPNAQFMELKNVINRKMHLWIRSALYAKTLRLNNEYIIIDQMVGGKKKKSITVMDKGTGVEQLSLKWSNGLHQFLQLKHGLELSPEGFKAVFLSNYFFFKRFGNNISGLSGTLGSDTEQRYLEELYDVELFKVPRFREERYIQYKPVVVGDIDEWFKCTETSIKKEVTEKRRATLIITDSVEEASMLRDCLRSQYPLIHTYTSSFDQLAFLSHDKEKLVGPGDIIIATNLAGRGSDFKTSKLLESFGGLHVLLTYLPSNIRILEQALRRTARAGNEGSGEIIVLDPQRRPFEELCRQRDVAEKQRLENVAFKEIRKIEFEHELLRGFSHNNEQIPGFQSILNTVKEALKNEDQFYVDAQIDSLKNRWSFWLDNHDEKIAMVHAIGKEQIIASYKEFSKGVFADFYGGGFRLIKEPAELIKFGGEYRQRKRWSEAARCYAEAGKDPLYAYALYYKAACELAMSPTGSFSAKMNFKANAKKADAAINTEIAQMQMSLQSVVPLVEKRRVQEGDADYGNPFKARGEERLQIWSIFRSAIESAIGSTLSPEKFKSSPHVKGEEGEKILKGLGNYCKPTRLSKKLTVLDGKLHYKGKLLPIPKVFDSVIPQLVGGSEIDKESLRRCCKDIVTQESALKLLQNCKLETQYRFSAIPPSFNRWPAGYSERVKFVLATSVQECSNDTFSSSEALKKKLKEIIDSHPILKDVDVNNFFTLLKDNNFIKSEPKINLAGVFVRQPPAKYDSKESAKQRGFTEAYNRLPAILQDALFKACCEREEHEKGYAWSLNTSINVGDLNLPKSSDDASDILWNILENHNVIKLAKIKVIQSYKSLIDRIKGDLGNTLGGKEALNSVFEIIDSSIGMIYKLEDKKTTAEFASIMRKCYHDHAQQAPEGLKHFIELGLEVIVDLIEKKDPPKWHEILTITAMAVVQMVAGAIIKAYLPVVGEMLANTLMSTGIDDIMFAVTSVATKEFSWESYATAKKASLKNALVSSAITAGVSFGVNAVKLGSVNKAWQIQKLSGIQKAEKAGKIVSGTFNIGTHIAKEVGRSLITMGITQLATYGLEKMTQLFSECYQVKISDEITKAVDKHWRLVVDQAQGLYNKIGGDPSIKSNVQGCLELSLKKMQKANSFDSAIRASKQVLPQASTLIGKKSWSGFVAHAPEIANLGVSMAKLANLVEDNVHSLARELRETRDRKDSMNPAQKTSPEEFHAFLGKIKSQYIEQLTATFNGVLNSAVYAPLISMGAQYLADKHKEMLLPLSEHEQLAQSVENLSEIMDIEKNPNKAFYDEALRHWREANDEVTAFSKEDLNKVPVNSDESIETLQQQYGSLVKIYKDQQGHLYAQRPGRAEYAKGVLEGKASGDPEILALSKLIGKNISIQTPDGKTKVYTQQGQVEVKDQKKERNTIYLKMETNKETGIGHVTFIGGKNYRKKSHSGNDCLYEAVLQGTGRKESVKELRAKTAHTLKTDESCKRFYHQWSISTQPKHFVGKDWNIGTRCLGLVQATGGVVEVVGGSAIIVESGGLAAVPGYILFVHGCDNVAAGVRTMINGEGVESLTTYSLKHGLGLSDDAATAADTALSFAGGFGGAAKTVFYRGCKVRGNVRLSEEAAKDLRKIYGLESANAPAYGNRVPNLDNLHRQLTAEQISSSWKFEKHAHEFGFKARTEYAEHIEHVMSKPDLMHLGKKGKGHWEPTAKTYFWDNKTKSIVVRDPTNLKAGGTAFKPPEGVDYFLYKIERQPNRPIDWLKNFVDWLKDFD